MTLDPAVRTRLDELVHSHRIVLFMKGVRGAPQCGFSAAVVDTLDKYRPDYVTHDVLRDPVLRESIKVYSEWPTIPQLYVDGEFVGGCDIVREMDASGELQNLLQEQNAAAAGTTPPAAPRLELTLAAVNAVREAMAGDDADDLCLRVTVDPGYYTELALEPALPRDLRVEVSGLSVVVDPDSASRADGVRIDFVTRNGEAGFRGDNPNAP
ncbi:MAG: Grx4 family monothiol glutaredoxin, partial [Myxococcales bacterium FL481]